MNILLINNNYLYPVSDSEVVYIPDQPSSVGICDQEPRCGEGECVDYGDRFRCRCPPGFREVQISGGSDCQETEGWLFL